MKSEKDIESDRGTDTDKGSCVTALHVPSVVITVTFEETSYF